MTMVRQKKVKRKKYSLPALVFIFMLLNSIGPLLVLIIYELIKFHGVIFEKEDPIVLIFAINIFFTLAFIGIIVNNFTNPINSLIEKMKNYRYQKVKPVFDEYSKIEEFNYLLAEYEKMIDEIISYQSELTKNAHLTAIGSTIAVISHELRTPLGTIVASTTGIKKYLPILIEVYKKMQKTSSAALSIRDDHLLILSNSVERIEKEAAYLSKVVNMLLVNASQEKIQANNFDICSISSCIQKALDRYPFNDSQRKNICWDGENEFLFNGIEVLVVHVLFNLIKNALHYIEAAEHGEILISLGSAAENSANNVLIFKDTGKGISSEILPRIFDYFFSKTHHGTGLGLAYCKMIMQTFGGDIICNSKEGEYTEFILSFPCINVS